MSNSNIQIQFNYNNNTVQGCYQSNETLSTKSIFTVQNFNSVFKYIIISNLNFLIKRYFKYENKIWNYKYETVDGSKSLS